MNEAMVFLRIPDEFVERYFPEVREKIVLNPASFGLLRLWLTGKEKLAARLAAQALDVAARRRCPLCVWASRAYSGLAEECRARGIALIRMEDGFLRSVGTGKLKALPYSLVVDRTGIYYDPQSESELESILQTARFDDELVARAARLRAMLLQRNVTKYNLDAPHAPYSKQDRLTVLVPGQVDDDASVLRGGCGLSSNLDLLKAVRAARPEAFILYKPHPDVELSGRSGRVPPEQALLHCDQIAANAPISALYDIADEVHTLTSLSGFEALLRGIPVWTYGQPFYAGWGLTTDRAPHPRRTRRLTLEELVAGALILYPRYYDWEHERPCQAEDVLDLLASRQHKAGDRAASDTSGATGTAPGPDSG